MIEQGKPYSFEIRNLRRVHRHRQIGEIFLVELEIDEETWGYLGTFPNDAEGVASVMWTERAMVEAKPKREPKPKPEPSPYGAFWRELDKTGFHNRPDVREWIGYTGTDEATAKDLIREKLGVEKRSREASPEKLIAVLWRYDGLRGAITSAELAKARTRQEVA